MGGRPALKGAAVSAAGATVSPACHLPPRQMATTLRGREVMLRRDPWQTVAPWGAIAAVFREPRGLGDASARRARKNISLFAAAS
jgi:hypothetical protein